MTTKWTPGPWAVEPGCYTIRAINQPLRAETGLAPPAVAVVIFNQDDARLIAAAPQLVEALQKIAKSGVRDNGPVSGPYHNHVVNVARAALKAAGWEG